MDSAGTGYVYANDNPVNAVDPSGKFSISVIGSGLIPFAIIVTLTPQDLAFLSTPGGAIVGSLIGLAVTALVNYFDPGLGFIGGLLTTYIIGNILVIKAACPGGAYIVYYLVLGEPYYVCA